MNKKITRKSWVKNNKIMQIRLQLILLIIMIYSIYSVCSVFIYIYINVNTTFINFLCLRIGLSAITKLLPLSSSLLFLYNCVYNVCVSGV